MFGKKKVSKEFVEETYIAISQIHDMIIRTSGGTHGIRDQGGFYHSIYKILSNESSQNPFIIGALVYEELARRHHFSDGNKRTAHTFAKMMLFLEGFHLKIDYVDAVKFIIQVAAYQSPIQLEEIETWVQGHLAPVPQKYRDDIEKYLNDTIIDFKDDRQ